MGDFAELFDCFDESVKTALNDDLQGIFKECLAQNQNATNDKESVNFSLSAATQNDKVGENSQKNSKNSQTNSQENQANSKNPKENSQNSVNFFANSKENSRIFQENSQSSQNAKINSQNSISNALKLLPLAPKLYAIAHSHKAATRFYQKTIKAFPELKRARLETLSDYETALKVQKSLPFLLGNALIKAWQKGALLALPKALCAVQNEHQLFVKNEFVAAFRVLRNEYLRAQNERLKALKLDFDENLKNGFLMINSQKFEFSQNAQEFIRQHFESIFAWINSQEFKQKYLDIKHPYPPLLNPALLNDKNSPLNYGNISAEIAWELNLPLPRNYKFIHIAHFGSAYVATQHFYRLCGLVVHHRWEPKDAKNTYIQLFNSLKVANLSLCNMIYLDGFNLSKPNQVKFYALIDAFVPVISVVRDPIQRFKPLVNHIQGGAAVRFFNLTFDYKSVLRVYYYQKGKGWQENSPIVENLETGACGWHSDVIFTLHSRIEVLKNKTKLIFVDMAEIMPDKAFETMSKLAAKLGFNPPKLENKAKFEGKINGGDYLGMQKWLFLHDDDINNAYEVGKANFKNENSLTKPDSLKLWLGNLQNAPQPWINGNEVIFDDEIGLQDFGVYFANKNDIARLQGNEKLYAAAKKYLNGYIKALKEAIVKENSKRISEKQILEYLAKHKETRDYYKRNFDLELQELRAERPDIVESWKYYNEFEKMCAEFDKG